MACQVQLSERQRLASAHRQDLALRARLLQGAGGILKVVRQVAVGHWGEFVLVLQRDASPAAHLACPDREPMAQLGEKDSAALLAERLVFVR